MKTTTYNPETHVLVPREPSNEMCDAATADSCWENMNPPPSVAYRSMLAAAPKPEPVDSEPVYQVCMADSVSLSGAWIDVDKQTYHDAGLYKEYKLRSLYTTPQPDRTAELEQLRQRVAELERERCAKVCEELRHPDGYSGENVDWCAGTDHCAAAIRAMGDE